MPTNANTFNSRVTSEALEAKFRQVFPAQGGAELVQDLFASGVIQPVVDFSSVAEGSVLPQNLQTAYDFATTHTAVANTTTDLITNTGFWKVGFTLQVAISNATVGDCTIFINDGATNKTIWKAQPPIGINNEVINYQGEIVVFLRTGDTLRGATDASNRRFDFFYRQIADVNGILVNPLGFTFS
jgi:hypothetical protein